MSFPFTSSTTGILVRRLAPRLKRWRRWFSFALSLGLIALTGALAHPRSRTFIRYFREPACYVVPVAGTRAVDLRSTFGAPRPGGRKHRGVDIFAARGTAVLSATDGIVMRVGHNKLGGRIVAIFGQGNSVYYYAHLQRWAPGLRRGQMVHAGEVIGSVGNSGNARTTPTHLHFSVGRRRLIGGRLHVDPVRVLSRGRTMPDFDLEGGVDSPGAGKRPKVRVPEWGGDPCALPTFPNRLAQQPYQGSSAPL